jgi:AP2 domain.
MKQQIYNKDLTGQTFGRLRAIAPTEKRSSRGYVVWKCECECGNTVYRSTAQLNASTKSCGCKRQEVLSEIKNTLDFVDGTCPQWLENRTHRCDNTSGFRGVSLWRGKWKAGIGFKGKRYHLGYFDSKQDAINARLKAEEELYIPFLAEYRRAL